MRMGCEESSICCKLCTRKSLVQRGAVTQLWMSTLAFGGFLKNFQFYFLEYANFYFVFSSSAGCGSANFGRLSSRKILLIASCNRSLTNRKPRKSLNISNASSIISWSDLSSSQYWNEFDSQIPIMFDSKPCRLRANQALAGSASWRPDHPLRVSLLQCFFVCEQA